MIVTNKIEPILHTGYSEYSIERLKAVEARAWLKYYKREKELDCLMPQALCSRYSVPLKILLAPTIERVKIEVGEQALWITPQMLRLLTRTK